MEVTSISKGRQNSTDYNLNTVVKDIGVDTSMLPSIEPIKSPNKDFSKDDIKVSVEKLNKFLQDENVHAEYEMHEKLNQIMIKIVNTDTKEIIMEIPPKKIIDMVAKMCEMVGLLVDKKA
ncbi:flagellar protein FlaG [Clostridium algidicarnis]|uniref:flagellar protein FlaG n=1 Tax=Clostridium algidicarnis TaxID=37659 RepID=UPI001C0E0B74|nr:flagellar protein FlaG [Clostridium algidicarnis]MBU3193980.1 flagellar protein FlaG [Clostridium algidicarnis]